MTGQDNASLFSGGPARSAGKLSYVPVLDGLRALAVLAVLISHFGLGPVLEPLQSLLPLGRMGVNLFFVLSGFLITNILLNCRDNISDTQGFWQAIKAFYMRRVLRIFPVYYVTILCVLVFGAEEFRSVVWYHVFYLSNTASAVYAGPGATGALIHPASAHFWSLSVEEQFYLIWPFLVLLAPRRTLSALTIGLILLAPISRVALFVGGYQHIVGYLPTATDALCAGALLALYRYGDLSGRIPKYFMIAAGVSAIGFLACIVASQMDAFYRPREVLLPLFEAVLYVALINALLNGRLPRSTSVLSTAPLVAVGKVSYAVYLTHTFVANSVTILVPASADLPQFTKFLLATAATIAVAFISWYLLEAPINRYKSRFPYSGSAPGTPVRGASQT